jgi:hypothetical protein
MHTEIDVTKAARSNLTAYAVFITDSKVLQVKCQWGYWEGRVYPPNMTGGWNCFTIVVILK